jgi:outer membrane protein OmpA-like peptidoglycan-associated protein
MKKIFPAAAAALALAGCVTAPPPRFAPYSPPPGNMHHAQGRVAAQKADEPTPHVAEVKPLRKGELTAQNVENYMDAQERELRTALRGRGIVVSRVGDNLAIVIPSDSLFAGDSDALSGRGRTVLTRIALYVRKYDSTRISINGFTDSTGTAAQANQKTQTRADAVRRALAADGVDSRRIDAKGLGAQNARVPTAANVAEPRNRRVEIEISPILKG